MLRAIPLRPLALGVTALLAALLALVALFGVWSEWDIRSFIHLAIEWRIDGVANNFGGERQVEPYGGDEAPVGRMFALTRLLLVVGILASFLVAAVSLLGLAPRVRLPPGLSRWSPYGMAVAALLLLAAPVQVALAMPVAVAQMEGEEPGTGEPSPATSFWGSDGSSSWRAGPAWYFALAAGLAGCVAALVGLTGAPAPRSGPA